MAMLADYVCVDDETLDAMIRMDTEALVERIDELEESGSPTYRMDKWWDILHYALTGVSASTPIEGDPLSEAVVGVHVFDVDYFVGATQADELPRIVSALASLDLGSRRRAFTLSGLREHNIFPSLAETDEQTDAVWEHTSAEFTKLSQFLSRAAQDHMNVIVSIY